MTVTLRAILDFPSGSSIGIRAYKDSAPDTQHGDDIILAQDGTRDNLYEASGVSLDTDTRYTVDIYTASDDANIDASGYLGADNLYVGEDDGTYRLGADQILLGSLYAPDGSPAAVIPDPDADVSLCTVYLNAEDITNTLSESLVVNFTLIGGPAKSERVLDVQTVASMTTNASGYASVSLQRNDLLTPSTTYYKVTCRALGLHNVRMTLEAATYNLADLIS